MPTAHEKHPMQPSHHEFTTRTLTTTGSSGPLPQPVPAGAAVGGALRALGAARFASGHAASLRLSSPSPPPGVYGLGRTDSPTSTLDAFNVSPRRLIYRCARSRRPDTVAPCSPDQTDALSLRPGAPVITM